MFWNRDRRKSLARIRTQGRITLASHWHRIEVDSITLASHWLRIAGDPSHYSPLLLLPRSLVTDRRQISITRRLGSILYEFARG